MKLSVIIVNYNVKYFLEQCLYSVRKAIAKLEQPAEVFIVDNNSVDGSVEMLYQKFSEFRIIANAENVGFSKGNNIALKEARGEYVLLLNPDTIVEDDTFIKVVNFMDQHTDAGGLGVKMVDGKGVFLPESKRGLPTPDVAFYKIFGLSKLFPGSRVFGKYHLGYLPKDEIHEVDILSGAFMLMRKSVLDKIGLLDETFFMYGEDIDLSYRIIKAGYKNYYFPETRIIHYKGESTKKSSINYVLVFYNAMIIFAKKHFSTKNAKSLSFLINMAIYFRAFLAILNRFFAKTLIPIIDVALLSVGIFAIKSYWETNVIFPGGGSYPAELVSIAIPLYVFSWLFSVYMSGGYDRPIQLYKIFKGLVIGSIVILIAYALLPEALRFSRAIILFGALWGLVSMAGLRVLLHLLGVKKYQLGVKLNKRYLIAGDQEEASRVADLLRKTDINPGFIGLANVTEGESTKDGFIGNLSQIKDIINIYNIDEVIFCARDIPAHKIIDIMSGMKSDQLDFKIAPPESMSIIGSQSINTSGDAYIIELDSVNNVHNQRSKRFLDMLVSVGLLSIFPVAIFAVKNPLGYLLNIFKVLFGVKTWVGYKITQTDTGATLPRLKKGVLNPADAIKNKNIGNDTMNRLNLLYARDYKISNDLNIIRKGFRMLGRSR